MALFIYGTATNYGKNFFTHEDRRNFFLRGYPANVWVVGNNEKGATWLAEKNGVEKTKTQAQALVTAVVDTAQETWDDDDVDGESSAEKIIRLGPKPTDITIP
tara:strand:- start:88 stop:396 length:309 start_codon:yes stop_codon:yes gene_type:complete